MLVTEALKLIGSKPISIAAEIRDRTLRLRKAASKPSDIKTLEYGSATEQTDKVKELVQGALDKVCELGKLRHAVYLLNTTTELTLELDGKPVTKTVDHWIFRKDTGIALCTQILVEGLKDVEIPANRVVELENGKKELVQLIRFYSTEEKERCLALLLEEKRAIETALDRFNCTTEIPAELLG